MVALLLLFTIIHQDTSLALKPKAYRVKISLAGRVSILKGKPGKIRIEADYPDSLRDKFKILCKGEEISIGFPEDTTQEYRFNFSYSKKKTGEKERRVSVVGRGWRRVNPLRFKILLPEDRFLDLMLGLSEAESDIELGSLRIRSLEYLLVSGEGRVGFEKENRVVMEDTYFAVGGAKLKIEKLGNASPKDVEIDGGVARIDIDLGGRWRETSEIKISSTFGDILIKAPEELEISAEKEGVVNIGSLRLSSKNPKVRLSFKGAFNLLDFERY